MGAQKRRVRVFFLVPGTLGHGTSLAESHSKLWGQQSNALARSIMPMSELERMRFLSRALEESLITGVEYEELAPRMRDTVLQTVEEDTPPDMPMPSDKQALASHLAQRVIEMAQTVERSHVIDSGAPIINGQPTSRPPEVVSSGTARDDGGEAASRGLVSRSSERRDRFSFQANEGSLAHVDPIQVTGRAPGEARPPVLPFQPACSSQALMAVLWHAAP